MAALACHVVASVVLVVWMPPVACAPPLHCTIVDYY